jgi:hypothetical protein
LRKRLCFNNQLSLRAARQRSNDEGGMHGQRLGQSRLSSAPIGLQVVEPHLGDARLLRAAALFEAARPWVQHRPSATV